MPAMGRRMSAALISLHALPEVSSATTNTPFSLSPPDLQRDLDTSALERSSREMLPQKSILQTPVSYLEQCYGRNIGFYFLYLRWTMVLFLLISIPGLVLLILQNGGWRSPPDRNLTSSTLDVSPYLYIAFYDPEMFWFWRGATVVNGTIVALCALLYLKYLRSQKSELRKRDPFVGQQSSGFGADGVDAIAENQRLSPTRRAIGKCISYAVFFLVLAVEAVVNYYLAVALVRANDTAIATVLSLVLAIFNALWQLACEPVTDLEKPLHFNQKFNSYFNKCVAFQMISACILFSVTHTNIIGSDAMQQGRCSFELLAHEYPVTLASTVIAAPAVQIFVALALRTIALLRRSSWCRSCGQGVVQANVRNAFPEFNLGDEYTAVLYIQFLCVQGQVVFPLLPLLGFVGLAAKFWIDKVRLFRYCRPLATTKNAFGKRLFIWNIVNLIIAFFLVPSGIFWIWRGDRFFVDESSFEKCRIYQNLDN